MKNTLIALIILGCAAQVKAQKMPVLPNQQPLPQFRILPDSLSRSDFSFKIPDSLGKFKTNALFKQNIVANANMDNMPVARLQNNAPMPVVQTDRTAYNMPVAGMNLPKNYTMKKPDANPGVLPFFEGKPPIYYEFKKYPNGTPPTDNTKK